MINRTHTLLHNLTEQFYFIDLETDNLVHKSEKAIEICIESINKLKKLISKYNFKSQQEEILFFKEIKPQFNSKRIYYNTLSLSKGEATCDLSVKNPNKPEEPHSTLHHRPPPNHQSQSKITQYQFPSSRELAFQLFQKTQYIKFPSFRGVAFQLLQKRNT